MKKKLLKKLMVLALSAVTAFSAVPAAMVTAAGNPYPTTQDVDHVTDEEKEYFKWLCRMYNEGILDPNFACFTQTYP